jgi:predicted ABC-type ATPase
LKPVFYVLAGPNGAGKSTLYESAVASGLLPSQAEFVNADAHELQNLGHVADPRERSFAARAWADARRSACLKQGATFVSETVFSHPSKLALMQQARDAGFAVVLLVVCVSDPHQLLARWRHARWHWQVPSPPAWAQLIQPLESIAESA